MGRKPAEKNQVVLWCSSAHLQGKKPRYTALLPQHTRRGKKPKPTRNLLSVQKSKTVFPVSAIPTSSSRSWLSLRLSTAALPFCSGFPLFLLLKNMEGYSINQSNESLQLICRKTLVHSAQLLISFAQLIALGTNLLLFHLSPHKGALNWSFYLP